MTTTREEIIGLVESNRDKIDVADVGDGVSDEWIVKAEERLGLLLPDTYKWFLRTFGGGEIAGQEIYSIYEMEFEEAVGGDIVYMFITHEKNETFGIDKLVVCNNNGEEMFYFATTQPDGEGEYPIYRIDRIEGTETLYGDNFLEFLKNRIMFLCH